MAHAFDWQAAYARLDQMRRTLESGVEPAPAEVSRILRERAAALARPREEAASPAETSEVVVFSLSGERYAVEANRVLEVLPLRDLTPVPWTPPFVLGVVNHRGQILPVLNLRRLLDLAGDGAPEDGQVVAVEVEGMTFGILADAVAGSSRVAAHDLAPPPAAFEGDRRSFTRGVTRELVALLDLDALAREPRITINEESAWDRFS
jgi:purine-binding chemotaxis protein CheW